MSDSSDAGPPLLTKALEALPHGAAFRFVDSLEALEPGRSGRGVYRVRGDEAFLSGHFPGAPMMPGVILIEALAQLAGVVAQSDPAIHPMDDLRLSAVRVAKITGSAAPGESLEMVVEITGRLGALVQAQGRITCAGRVLLTAQIVLSGAVGRG